jgi:hypothetical protein
MTTNQSTCGLCDDPKHTAGIAEEADGSWHVFSSHEEQARRIAAAKAANERIAAAKADAEAARAWAALRTR